jgi:dienelactone hydrolase
VGLVALFYLGGGFYFSDVLDERALDGESMRAAGGDVEPDVVVTEVGADTIDLTSLEPPAGFASDGYWGLRWEGGFGRLGEVVAVGTPPAGEDAPQTVQRRFELLGGSLPAIGQDAEWDVRIWQDADSLGLPYEDVEIPTDLGPMPAWLFLPEPPAQTDPAIVDTLPPDTWAIVVHGNSMRRADGLRAVPTLVEAGLPTLVVTYRNDPGAPEDPSDTLRYGLTEWSDLEAAVAYALDHGATRVIPVGYSMGGGIVVSFLLRSELADRVPGAILDAPMLDFGATVDDNAGRETLPVLGVPLPSSLTAVAKQMAAWRFGVDWEGLDYVSRADELTVPFVVFHGTDDTTVPIATSEAFAEARPDLVQLIACQDAEHIACWNTDSARYARAIQHFVDEQLE